MFVLGGDRGSLTRLFAQRCYAFRDVGGPVILIEDRLLALHLRRSLVSRPRAHHLGCLAVVCIGVLALTVSLAGRTVDL